MFNIYFRVLIIFDIFSCIFHSDWVYRFALGLGDINSIQLIPQQKKFNLVVSNPPYIPTHEIQELSSTVKDFESWLALDGGVDGMELTKNILMKSPDLLESGGKLWLEVGEDQPPLVAQLTPSYSKGELKYLATHKDYRGVERFCELLRI